MRKRFFNLKNLCNIVKKKNISHVISIIGSIIQQNILEIILKT